MNTNNDNSGRFKWSIVHGPGCTIHPCDECKNTRELNDIQIWCGLCEEKVSLHDCLNKSGAILTQGSALILGDYYKTGEQKIVCPNCVSRCGMEAALDMAKPLMEVLIAKYAKK